MRNPPSVFIRSNVKTRRSTTLIEKCGTTAEESQRAGYGMESDYFASPTLNLRIKSVFKPAPCDPFLFPHPSCGVFEWHDPCQIRQLLAAFPAFAR